MSGAERVPAREARSPLAACARRRATLAALEAEDRAPSRVEVTGGVSSFAPDRPNGALARTPGRPFVELGKPNEKQGRSALSREGRGEATPGEAAGTLDRRVEV